MEHVRELVPPRVRMLVYAVYVLAGLIVGGFSAAMGDSPAEWIIPAERVLAYLAVPLMVLAGVNVPDTDNTYDPRH